VWFTDKAAESPSCGPVTIIHSYMVSGFSQVEGSCSDPPVVEHATVRPSNVSVGGVYPEGSQVKYDCNDRYEISRGDRTFTCSGGSWVGDMRCTEILCPLVNAPANGRIDGSPSYTIGTYVTFKCNVGYDLIGHSQILCRVDYEYNYDPPTCRIKMCPEFGLIDNGRVFQETAGGILNDYGSIVKVECKDRYILKGNPQVHCQSDGTWSERPTCDEITCSDFKGKNSNCVGQYMSLLSYYYMTCRENYPVTRVAGPDANEPNECTGNGWKFQEFGCYCGCNMTDYNGLIMAFSNLDNKNFLVHDGTLQWSCINGCTKTVVEDIKCTDGNLNVQPNCSCPIITTPPVRPDPTTQPDPVERSSTQLPPREENNTWLIAVIVAPCIILAIVIGLACWKREALLAHCCSGNSNPGKRGNADQPNGQEMPPLLEDKKQAAPV